MGKYDIGAELTPECRLSLDDLVDELDKELELYDDLQTYKDKFHNNDKSGLIDKLKKILYFDIDNINKESDKEKFDMLKLLKALFYIEKYGVAKCDSKNRVDEDIRIRITDILEKPRLSNVNSYLSEVTQYGDVFERLFNDIKGNVDDADERIDMIEKVDDYWQYIAAKQFDYTFSDMALHHPDDMLTELKRINEKLEDIINNIDISAQQNNLQNEGVMKIFFNILLTHRKLCYDIDRIRCNEFIDIDISSDKEYAKRYLEHENILIDISTLEFLKKSLSCKNKDNDSNIVFDLASYYKEIPCDDYKHYRYALDKLPIVLNWLMKEKPEADYSRNVPIIVMVAIIQEIVEIKKNSNKYKVCNDFYGYKATGTSLLSALKQSNPAPILVYIWVRRVETRFAINYGAHDLIIEKNKAELALFKIKEYIYGFRNINQLKTVNNYLSHQVVVAHIGTIAAAEKEREFRGILTDKLNKYGISINIFAFQCESQDIYDLFRELLATYGLDMRDKLAEISEQICQCIVDMQNKLSMIDTMDHIFKICFSVGSQSKCTLEFKYDEICQMFLYCRFSCVYLI